MLTEEQKTMRKRGVGASEIAAVLGINPWASPVDVWARKLGYIEDIEETAAMKRGNYLEPSLVAWASAELGIDFFPSPSLTYGPEPIILATPDGISDGAVLEVKAPGARTLEHWADGPPDYYVVQVSQQMLATGKPVGYLAGLVGGELQIHTIERDAELESTIIDAAQQFWRYVETEQAPPVDHSPTWRDYIQKKFGPGQGEKVQAAPEVEELARRYLLAKEESAAIEKQIDTLKNQLALMCGEHAGFLGEGWRLSYTTPKASVYFDAKAATDAGALSEDVIKKYSKYRDVSRRFDLRAVKSKK